MQVKVKKLPKSEAEINFIIPAEEFNKFREKAILKLGEDFEIKGFRKGKAPREIIEKEFGQERIFREVAEFCIKENYIKAILESEIEPLGQPVIEILKLTPGNPLEFKAKVSVLPEVKLPDYKKIASETKKEKVSVSEKEIEEILRWLQKSRAKFITKNEPAWRGDFVEIEFSSPQIEDGVKKTDAFILGEGHLIPGLEENLVGLKNNEEKTFSLTFPESFPKPEFRGVKVSLKVKMRLVQKIELPDATDEWTRGLGQFENLAALKTNIKKGLNLEKEEAEIQRVRQEIIEKITKNTEIEIPGILVKKEVDQMTDSLKQGVSQNLQISFQDYLNQIKKTEEELKESFFPEARKRVKNSLVLREIGKRENIEASEEEVKEEINKVLEKYSSTERAKTKLDQERLRVYAEGVIKNEKTFQFLEDFTKK